MTDGWTDYACEYRHEGRRWALVIPARSWEDAQARLLAIGRGEVVGREVATYPVPGFIGRIVALIRGGAI